MTPEQRVANAGLTRRMAEAMYEVDVAGRSHRDAVAFVFADHDTMTRYCTMAQAARRIMEEETKSHDATE